MKDMETPPNERLERTGEQPGCFCSNSGGPRPLNRGTLERIHADTMTAAHNKRLLQEVFAETAKGNGRPFVAALAEEVTWTIIGSTQWSKTYRGKKAVLKELLGPLNAQLANGNTITARRFIAEDDYVVVEGRGHNATKMGKPYHNTYCWVFRLSGGQVVELTEYADTALIESALLPPETSGGST